MRVLLGSPIWYGNRPFRRTIEELYALGLDFVEFSLDYPLPECMSNAEKTDLIELLAILGMGIAFHSPLDITVMHPREELTNASMAVLKRCMEFSAEFDPLYYNLHIHPRLSTYKIPEIRAEVKSRAISRYEEIARLASGLGMQVCVENDLVPFEWSDMILEALSSSRFYLTLDIGHAILAELGRSTGDYIEHIMRWVNACGTKIAVVHLHDCSLDDRQDHISIGRGDLDLDLIFELLGSTGVKYMVIEVFWRDRTKSEMDYEELRRNVEFCKRYIE